MDTSVQFEIISETFIKPSFPTPPSLRYHKLSNIDQVMTKMHLSMAFFYPNIQGTAISQALQIALSKTLTHYYPFGGRLMNNLFIDCNDMGAHFIEARIKCPMSMILEQPYSDLKDLVFPSSIFSSVLPTDSLMIVQLNYFDCGGMALSACFSHKLADAFTVSTFMNDWTAMARQLSDLQSPHFNGASLFPPVDDPLLQEAFPIEDHLNSVTRRFLFPASKIEELKAMAANSGVDNPTRFEVVNALIYSCAISASMTNSGSFQPSILANAVNFRSMVNPPLPQKSMGNFLSAFLISVSNGDELELPTLVHKLRDGKLKFHNECKEKSNANEGIASLAKIIEETTENNFIFYDCSSWCRYPLYDVDFGWGRPSLVSPANFKGFTNSFILMDMENGDGIDAYVTLKKLDMSAFERNDMLLTFAS